MTATQQPRRLRTEYATNPPGIGASDPELRWRVPTERRGARQTAFRVLVASTPERLAEDEGDVWDTGKRESDRPAVRYDGPALESGAVYHWKVRAWDENDDATAWSDPARWGMGLLDADDWEASWIRRPEDGEFERGQFTYLRREFELDGDVSRARAYVAGCHQYALRANGEEVDRGQSFSYPDYHYYKTVDLTDELDSGANALGALLNWNGEGQGRPTAEPGFVLQLVVEFADGSERTLVTDESWTWREAEWRDAPIRNGEIGEPVETIDARRVPRGWAEPGFDVRESNDSRANQNAERSGDDGEWDPVAVVGEHPTDPWERLIAQEREVVRSPVEPESVERLDSGAYVFDFGKVYAGVPEVRFEEGVDGRRVEMRSGYLLRDDGSVDDTEGAQWTDMGYALVQRDGAQTFRPFNYLGFRYLQIDDPGEDLDLDRVRLIASRNGVPDEEAATFESSNADVDAVFDLARHSALYGCQEQFIDTPTREKGQFLMDAFNISQVTTRAFEERTLSRQAIREFLRSNERYWSEEGRLNAVYPNGDGKRDIPDFTESFPEWVWRYYRASGDRAILEEAYPVVRAVADYVDRHVDDETGLVTNLSGGVGGPYEEGIVDWPREMRYGYDRDWPARTTVNVLGANALDRAATIAAELDRPDEEGGAYRERAEEIRAAVNEHVRDGDRYVDGTDGSEASDHASQHASAFALAFGLVPAESVDAVADRVADAGMRMGPMMVGWLLEALEAADRPDAIVDLVTDPAHDGWADILAGDGTFTWETWKARDRELPDDERHNRSESHAMGATVLVYLQRALLGVRYRDPAGARVEIRPPATGLDSASGSVPTERGPVDVSWERDGSGLALDVTVPWNASATVALPATGEDVRVVEDGGVVWDGDAPDSLPEGIDAADRSDGEIVVEIRSGTYRFDLA